MALKFAHDLMMRGAPAIRDGSRAFPHLARNGEREGDRVDTPFAHKFEEERVTPRAAWGHVEDHLGCDSHSRRGRVTVPVCEPFRLCL